MNSKRIFALLLAMALCLTACAAPAGTPPVTHEGPLSRVVVFNAGLCTVLEAFGKTDCIVGAYGSLAESYGVPSCGAWNEVDVEAVIATGAEAVFGYAKYTTEDQIALLEAAGIACYFVELSDASAAADALYEMMPESLKHCWWKESAT